MWSTVFLSSLKEVCHGETYHILSNDDTTSISPNHFVPYLSTMHFRMFVFRTLFPRTKTWHKGRLLERREADPACELSLFASSDVLGWVWQLPEIRSGFTLKTMTRPQAFRRYFGVLLAGWFWWPNVEKGTDGNNVEFIGVELEDMWFFGCCFFRCFR